MDKWVGIILAFALAIGILLVANAVAEFVESSSQIELITHDVKLLARK